jgi:hypothetical protein
MTALENASEFLGELDKRHLNYQLVIARPEALMALVTVPGERWEIEFFDDGHIEIERFASQGVEDQGFTPAQALGYLDQRLSGEVNGETARPDSRGEPGDLYGTR